MRKEWQKNQEKKTKNGGIQNTRTEKSKKKGLKGRKSRRKDKSEEIVENREKNEPVTKNHNIGTCNTKLFSRCELFIVILLNSWLQELFKKLVPHQCLGGVWSRRDKSRALDSATVLATVNQFNAVSFRVISTILVDAETRPAERAAALAVWIDIAQVCGFMRANVFSGFYV